MTTSGGATPTAAKLVLDDVYKSYGDKVVLSGIDLEVDDHEVVCLIGPSGCGKSTLLRCVDLLDPIDSGTIRLDGDDAQVDACLAGNFADAGDRAAGAHAGDEGVERAARRLEDLRAGGPSVDLRVGRVLELLRHEVAVLVDELLGGVNRACHALDGRRQHEIRAEALHEGFPGALDGVLQTPVEVAVFLTGADLGLVVEEDLGDQQAGEAGRVLVLGRPGGRGSRPRPG